MDTTPWDAIVIGGGTAGLSAAQMLGRARRRTLVLDAGEPRNRFAAHMHGVLGLDGTPPDELIARGRDEIERYGVMVDRARVSRVDDAGSHVAVHLDDGRALSASAVVIATGIADDLPGIPGLAPRWGRTVLHCPYCHGWEVRDRRLGVLLTSPLGLHQAEMVRQWSADVTVFTALAGPIDPSVRARLEARKVTLVDVPVTEVAGNAPQIDAVLLADGRAIEIDALFTAGTPRVRDAFVEGLSLDRVEMAGGSFLAADATGRTSHPRIWAAGNAVSPMATVPMSMGAGAIAGAAINGALVAEDFDRAAREDAPAVFWEERYAGSSRVWSGNPNATLAAIVTDLETQGVAPGSALDLGCGEGADAIWLASRGWDATGLDISATAISRAEAAAAASDLSDRAHFVAADLSSWTTGDRFDLVTASFFQSPVALDRHRILRAAAERVSLGGHLLVVSHAAAPPWARHAHTHADFPMPDEERAALRLDSASWTTVVAEVRRRHATGPDGAPAELDDTVVLLRHTG